MAACMLSILDSLKLYDNNQLLLGSETLSEIMFRKMKGYNIDLNKELGFDHLEPVKNKLRNKVLKFSIDNRKADQLYHTLHEYKSLEYTEITKFKRNVGQTEMNIEYCEMFAIELMWLGIHAGIALKELNPE